jgi:hypothetical protein
MGTSFNWRNPSSLRPAILHVFASANSAEISCGADGTSAERPSPKLALAK